MTKEQSQSRPLSEETGGIGVVAADSSKARCMLAPLSSQWMVG
jgi:hypothetical protein